MLLQVNYEQIFTPIILSGIVALVVWIFRTKTEETKERIDARQEEIKHIQDRINSLSERLAVLEKDSQNQQNGTNELKQALKEQRAEFNYQFNNLSSQVSEILKQLKT